MNTEKWIWVTGASGYTGPFLVEELRKRFPESSILATGRREPRVNADRCLALDLTVPKDIDSAMERYPPRTIYHLAAAMPPQADQDLWYFNTAMTFELLSALHRQALTGVKVLSVGSAAELQYKPQGGAYTETDRALGATPYGKSKAAQYLIARSLADELGVDVFFPRAFNFIGPGLPDKWVAGRLCKQLTTSNEKLVLGNLQAERDFVDIRDVVAAYCDIVERGKPGELYNVCTGNPVAIEDLVAQATSLLRDAAPEIESDAKQLVRPEVSVVYGDPGKVNTEIGWQPKISLTESLVDMLESYKNA